MSARTIRTVLIMGLVALPLLLVSRWVAASVRKEFRSCEDRVTSRIPAPDDALEVIEFERVCSGRSRKYAALVPMGEAPSQRTRAFDAANWNAELRPLHWEDRRTLVVCGPASSDRASGRDKPRQQHGIRIRYAPACP